MCGFRLLWEEPIVELLLMIALIVPLIVIWAILRRIPLDFSPSTMSLPSVIVGLGSGFLLFGAGCYFMPVAILPLLGFGVALGIPVTAALLIWRQAPSNSNSWADYPVLIGISFAYCCGLTYLLNGVLTPAPAARVIAAVASKQTGVGGFPNYFLHLTSVDPRVGDGEWRVSRTSFFASQVGARACVDLYQGRFKATWYRAGPCPVSSDAEIPWVGFSPPFSGRIAVQF